MRKGPAPRPLAERFWEKVDRQPGDGCWLWTACLHRNGYGKFSMGRDGNTSRTALAHRVAYTLEHGEIPDGLTLDHLCGVVACVRPSHLQVVTGAVNNLRGGSASARNARKTHCPRGHEYSEANTYRRPSGARVCRTCARERRAAA